MTQFINTQRGSKWEKGDPGTRWPAWASINSAAFSGNDIVYWLTDWTSVTLVNWKTELTWPQGETWPAATITVWSTTTWQPWTSASVVNSWTTWAAILDFVIPAWEDWNDWQDWAAATISVWTTSTGWAWTSASVTNSWSSSAAVFNFTIPKGDTWATGNGISSVTTSKSGKVTTVTMNYTDWSTPTSFTVSDWADGEWAWDVVWPNSSTDGNVALFDWATGKLIKDSWKALTPAWIWALADSTKYGASISVSVDTTDYKITTTLKDQDWNTLGTAQTIDLPLESVVVSWSYDSVNKKVVLTLENGNTIEFSVADLVAWLQSEITSSNKLDADLVDDSTSTNKFVTASDKTTWNWKQDALIAWTNITIAADWKTISATDTTYSAATSSTLWLVKLWDDTVQSVAANAVSWTASRTYAIQTNSSDQLVVNVPWEDHTYTASSFDIKDLADSTGLRTTWSWKQDALTTQTAYTTKWTSTKVPTITTNTLGQVTAITETDITYPSQVDDTAYAASWDWVTTTAPSKNAVYDKISAMDTTIGWKADTSSLWTAAACDTWTSEWDVPVVWSNWKLDTSIIPDVHTDAVTSVNWNTWVVTVSEFSPSSSWTTGQYLKKTAWWYDWDDVSWGDVLVSSQANNILTSWMKIWAGTQANYESLWTYDTN